ncbi:variable surface protein [Plasmodium gonderi]|uniref:Variable surface protein n=1 Tax=Plasmodium gonderi TaxID=77519 RepID=A0A1Y1JVM5_PLAGO|nr:variable surface protein [Plasmodium gonderi]GAW83944.1 variable surface protein [Plasmodium gonderi]
MISIDEVLSKFPECKRRLDEKVHDSITHEGGLSKDKLCKESKYKLKDLIRNIYDPEKICLQVQEYLGEINNELNKSLNKAACAYFYYWIYDELLKDEKKEIKNIPIIYNEFVDIFIKTIKEHNNICKNSDDIIKEEDVPKLTIIYDMYKNEEYMKKACLPNRVDEYCNALRDYIKKYNNITQAILSEIHEPFKRDILPSHGYNIGSTIIITIFATLLISIFLFVLYEFTTIVSWLRRTILCKRKGLNNIEEKWEKYEGSDIYYTMSRNNENNILYHSK